MLHQFEEAARKARSTSIKLTIMPPQGESKETAIKFFEKHGYKFEIDFGFGPFYIKELLRNQIAQGYKIGSNNVYQGEPVGT